MPRVVTAGVPMRMPLAAIGGFGSNGIAFLLTVMPAFAERRFRGFAREAAREHIDEHQVVVGAAADQTEPAPTSTDASRLALATICF